MPDSRHARTRRVVMPAPTRTEEWSAFAEDLRAEPVGTYRDASEVAGEFKTADAAKSFAWRVNHGKAVAFRPEKHYKARTEGARVSVTYVGPRQPPQRAN